MATGKRGSFHVHTSPSIFVPLLAPFIAPLVALAVRVADGGEHEPPSRAALERALRVRASLHDVRVEAARRLPRPVKAPQLPRRL